MLAYVGSYTSAIDGGSNGKGVYRFEMDARTGAFANQKLVAGTPNPSWIAIHPSKKCAFVVNYAVGTFPALPIVQGGRLAALMFTETPTQWAPGQQPTRRRGVLRSAAMMLLMRT
jgi:6-phosphogluconolactonase (cycloisomerase 2 family)